MPERPTNAEVYDRARKLRQVMTPSQARLWSLLRGSRTGHRFRREHPFPPYILDFYCVRARVAVEVDGGSHDSEERQAHDDRRDAFLERAGVKVLRVPTAAVLHRPEDVVRWITGRCDAAATLTPPSRDASRSRHLPASGREESA